jgi:hypothetical protein
MPNPSPSPNPIPSPNLGYEVRERLRREDGAGGAFALLAIAHFVQSRLG